MHQPAHKLKFATRGRACPADWSGRPVLKHIPVSVLATYGGQNEDKKRYYSTTKVNSCTIAIWNSSAQNWWSQWCNRVPSVNNFTSSAVSVGSFVQCF